MPVKKTFNAWLIFLSLFQVLFALSGCGYHIAGKGLAMPWGVTSMAIPVFENDTAKPDIEGTVTSAFVNEFVNTVRLSGKGDAILKGVIKSYSLAPISFANIDVIQQYRLTVVISLKVVQEDTGKVLWENDISRNEDYTVNPSSILATRDAELAALKKIASDSARLAKERILERF